MVSPDRLEGRLEPSKNSTVSPIVQLAIPTFLTAVGMLDIAIASTKPGRKTDLKSYKNGRVVRPFQTIGRFIQRFGAGETVEGSVGTCGVLVEEERPTRRNAKRAKASFGAPVVKRVNKSGKVELSMPWAQVEYIEHMETKDLGETGIRVAFVDPEKFGSRTS